MHEKKEVIKHSAAIHAQNNISLLQRRASNVMLANAYDELPDDTIKRHRIAESVLLSALEFDSNNRSYLREALEALVTCPVKWNVLEKDKEVAWGITTFLSGVYYEDGIYEYAYSDFLREHLHNPRMYARLNLSIQNKFDSKHAQALWELCADYFDESRGFGETPFIELSRFRALMGVEEEYPQFKRLNECVIKNPIKEINRVTNFSVAPEYKRKGRKITAVKFRIRLVDLIPGQHPKQATLFPEYDDAPLVYELKNAGLSAEDAWRIWQQGFEGVVQDKRPQGVEWDAYLHEKIDLLRRRKAEGKVNSSTGFLLKAIRENYANAEFAEEQRKHAARVKAEEKARRHRQLTKEKDHLEKERSTRLHAIAAGWIEKAPEVLEESVAILCEKDAGFRHLYEKGKSPAENYRAAFLASYVDKHLMQQHPERFTELQERFDRRLAKIEQELSSDQTPLLASA